MTHQDKGLQGLNLYDKYNSNKWMDFHWCPHSLSGMSECITHGSRRKSRVGVLMLDVIIYLFTLLNIPLLFYMYQNIFKMVEISNYSFKKIDW